MHMVAIATLSCGLQKLDEADVSQQSRDGMVALRQGLHLKTQVTTPCQHVHCYLQSYHPYFHWGNNV